MEDQGRKEARLWAEDYRWRSDVVGRRIRRVRERRMPGTGQCLASPWWLIDPGHISSHQGPGPDGPRTMDRE